MAIKDGDVLEGKVIDLRVDKQHRTILSTVLLLPRSRRVLIGVVAFLVAGIVSAIPALQPFESFIGEFLSMAALLIAGLSVEDIVSVGAKSWHDNKNVDLEGEVTEIIESILNDALGGGELDEVEGLEAQGKEGKVASA
jgi:hypothetical protein